MVIDYIKNGTEDTAVEYASVYRIYGRSWAAVENLIESVWQELLKVDL